MIIGALVNAAAILVGGGLGLLLKGRVPQRIFSHVIKAIGLCVCIIGIAGALGGDIMLLVASLALGTFLGELVNIDGALNRLGERLQAKFAKKSESAETPEGSLTESTPSKKANGSFAEGFVAATLLFCVGAMAIVGSLESGLRGDYGIIFTKSILDGVSALILASLFGYGVLFSAAAVLLYQGTIEFFAAYMQYFMTDSLITQLSAAGGIMILAIGVKMALDAKIKPANMLPGFVVAVGYYLVFLA